jgi:hypothetical protein
MLLKIETNVNWELLTLVVKRIQVWITLPLAKLYLEVQENFGQTAVSFAQCIGPFGKALDP